MLHTSSSNRPYASCQSEQTHWGLSLQHAYVADVMPWARFGHVAWVHKSHMYIFGGKSSTLPDSSLPIKKMYLNDLWALDTSSYHWTQIRATGITPSPRADMGQSLHSPELQLVLLRNLFAVSMSCFPNSGLTRAFTAASCKSRV